MEIGLYAQTFGVGRNPYLQAQVAAAQSQSTQNALQQPQLASALAAQRTAPVIQQTQTAQAPQATGRTEASREARTGSETGATTDSGANALEADVGLLAVRPRGSRVDVYV
ncbi:MAG: hypothetical protein GC202_05265 [Alphaproteobacteria bacterium]|nr:hypothetical protein [Alphaproteobacteria bacterium]